MRAYAALLALGIIASVLVHSSGAVVLGGEPVTLAIALKGLDPAALSAASTLHLRQVASLTKRGNSETDEAPELDLLVHPGPMGVELPPDTWWKVEAEIPGFWSQPVVVAAEEGEVQLQLFRTGHAQVSVVTPRGAVLPERLTVAFTPTPRRSIAATDETPSSAPEDALRGEADCERTEPPRWTCELPGGGLDLRFHAPGFASEFRWNVSVPAGGLADLGALELTEGAALVGRLELPAAEALDLDSLELVLVPEALTSWGPRLDSMSRRTRPRRDGWFQFRDLAPGSYRLTAKAEGWATSERLSIEVLAGRETELVPSLQMARPAIVEICFDPHIPPGAYLDGDTWRPSLYPDTTDPRPPLTGSVEPDGCFRRDEVQPGWYRLVVGDRRRSSWLERRVSIPSGDYRLDIEVPGVMLEGTITRQGDPVRARLTFLRHPPAVGDRRVELRTIVLYSDLKGTFTGALPEEGRWAIKAAFHRLGPEQFLQEVEVRKPERGAVRLDLEVPGTRLRGRVVTARGEGIARVSVNAHDRSIDAGSAYAVMSSARTDEDGRFTFQGLAPGHYTIDAITRGGSAQVEIDLEDLVEPPEVELVIGNSTELKGHVISERGPVIGAQIIALPEFVQPMSFQAQTVATDVRGEFSLMVPEGATGLSMIVLPPGYAARVLRIAAGQEGPVVVPVDEIGGTLVLPGGSPDRPVRGGLTSGGVPIPLMLLRGWSQLGTGRPPGVEGAWTVPMMPVGEYTLCSPDGRCDQGFLAPFDTLTLSVPEAAAGDEKSASR